MTKADILIVEDDEVIASLFKTYLERSNYNVIDVISDGEKAVRIALNYNPDLILLDIYLKSSIDGIEVAKRINTQKEIPIIFLTADSSDETIQRAKITQPHGYLVKPVDSVVLITNIELILQKQYAHNKVLLESLKKAYDELESKVRERTIELYKANEKLKNEIEQRVRIEKEFRRADTLVTIGKMSAVLAHEIRNPLNSIKINADILIDNDSFAENQKKRLKIIHKEVERLNNLVKDVLLFSRQNDLLLSEFGLENFFETIHLQLKAILEEKKIDIEFKTTKVKVRGDIEKLKQVFLNLIINAIDAIYENGRIEINSFTNRKDKFIIEIKDNGCGIADTSKLFEPFYTTKNLGTGLGLPISQNILRRHDGNLYLLSSKPNETIFRIELPLNNIIFI